jgi:hypothetical protein
MRAKFLVIVIWFALTGSFGFAQDEKTEIGVFAGGYFNSGFQSFKVLNPTTGAQVGTYKPVSEANSGIFGVRGSYNFKPQWPQKPRSASVLRDGAKILPRSVSRPVSFL